MKLILSKPVVKSLQTLPKKDALALVEKLKIVAADSFGHHPWATRMSGSSSFRVRQGEWRAVYSIETETQEVIVDHIEHRREVYR